MNLIQKNKEYYKIMLKNNQLIPFFYNGRTVAFITFSIKDNIKDVEESTPWEVKSNRENGNICYIEQLITDKNNFNPKISYKIWYRFKSYIKNNFPSVNRIVWNRFKNDKLKSYQKEI